MPAAQHERGHRREYGGVELHSLCGEQVRLDGLNPNSCVTGSAGRKVSSTATSRQQWWKRRRAAHNEPVQRLLKFEARRMSCKQWKVLVAEKRSRGQVVVWCGCTRCREKDHGDLPPPRRATRRKLLKEAAEAMSG